MNNPDQGSAPHPPHRRPRHAYIQLDLERELPEIMDTMETLRDKWTADADIPDHSDRQGRIPSSSERWSY